MKAEIGYPENLLIDTFGTARGFDIENFDSIFKTAAKYNCGFKERIIEFIYAKYRDGKTYDEIAAKYGVTKQCVWKLLTDALVRLRKNDMLNLLQRTTPKPDEEEAVHYAIDENTSVNMISFDNIVANAIHTNNIATVGELIKHSERNYEGLKDFGPKTIKLCNDKITQLGLLLDGPSIRKRLNSIMERRGLNEDALILILKKMKSEKVAVESENVGN